jgi:hypothetical protein
MNNLTITTLIKAMSGWQAIVDILLIAAGRPAGRQTLAGCRGNDQGGVLTESNQFQRFYIIQGSGNFLSEALYELSIHLRRLQTHA